MISFGLRFLCSTLEFVYTMYADKYLSSNMQMEEESENDYEHAMFSEDYNESRDYLHCRIDMVNL